MKGEHKAGYRRPRTGEERRWHQPLRIDKLSQETRDAILKARAEGCTWEETAERASKIAGETLAMSVVHRWYDLRVAQVQKEVMEQAERSRAIAAAFAGKGFEKLPEAVQSALSSAVFALAEEQDEKSRLKFIAGMNQLAWLLARNRQLDQEEKRLALESKKLDAIVAKVQGLKQAVEKKKLSPEELARKLDEIYDIGRQAA